MDGDIPQGDAAGRLVSGIIVMDANRDEFPVGSGEELLEQGDDLEALLSKGLGGLAGGGGGGGRGGELGVARGEAEAGVGLLAAAG